MTDRPHPEYRPPAAGPAPTAFGAPLAAPVSFVTRDEAREQAIRILTDRYADESLTEAEFEARLATLGAARSTMEMQAVVADVRLPRTPLSQLRSSTGTLPSAGTPERMLSLMSNTRRMGQWVVPERLEVRSLMSETRLDLRHAVVPRCCTIDLFAIMANLKVIVPPDLVTALDVHAVMSTLRNDEMPRSDWGAPARVRITGTAIMSEVRLEVRERGW